MSKGKGEANNVFHGIPVSSGIGHGPVLVVGPRSFQISSVEIPQTAVDDEIQRFKRALVKTREELKAIQKELCRRAETSDAGIFDAHLLVLEDQTIIEEVTRLVAENRINVEAAFSQTTERFISALNAVEDNYLRDRAVDMRDVADRVLGNLLGGGTTDPTRNLKVPSIIVGHDLSPSVTAQFDREKVLGFATDVGSPTSHTAILARSLNLPAVVALHDVSSQLRSGQDVLLDGYDGIVIRNPSESDLFRYGELIRRHESRDHELEAIRELRAETLDGVDVELLTNIDHPDEVDDVARYGGQGVGLFRTEYLFLNRGTLPDETEQFEAYRNAVQGLEGRPLVIRTLDLGADKVAAALPDAAEANPALGVRAIRFSLAHPSIFIKQLRAILRASAYGPVKLLYPMVSTVEELSRANELLEACREELKAASVAFDAKLPVGIMIETPTAAMIADVFSREVDFLCIGTNDLIQYGSAVDRLNERITDLYQPTHPGILRLIGQVVDAGARENVPVSVCGEMAADPVLVPLLIGLGVRALSVSAPLTPQVKDVIRKLKMASAEALAQSALAAVSSEEVMGNARALLNRIAPDLDASST